MPTSEVAIEPNALNAASLRPAKPKLVHLQILRALAASLVVVDHTFSALEHRGVDAHIYVHSGYLMGHLGVTAFFVLSGLIMMRQSADLFGTKTGPFLFAYRRLTRIVPMYWIATLLFFFFFKARPLVQPVKELLLSLFFIPDFIAPIDRLEPVLGQGWTLNYEMYFYLLFALSLFFPRRKGILFLLIVPELLSAIGETFHFRIAGAASSLLNFYTDQLIVLFARGVLIGAWETESRHQLRLNLPFSPAYFLLVPPALMLAMPYRIGAYNSWSLLSVLSILIVLACTLVDNGEPGRITRWMVLLGDASYCTYLFHLLATKWIANAAWQYFGHQQARPQLALAEAAIAVILANLLGLAIHVFIERRITRALKTPPFGILRSERPNPA
jgi:exopolysaccharide production protein ExoZ